MRGFDPLSPVLVERRHDRPHHAHYARSRLRIERYRRPLLYVLEVQDCTRYRWHEMYVASTLAEVEKAFVAYSEGETPESSEVWP
jgi:hypothetical protein